MIQPSLNFESDVDKTNANSHIWHKYLPIISKVGDRKGVPVNVWDIPYSIPKLAYLTHGHFRYYGKFPSVVAGQILDSHYDFSQNRPVFDNFCGSGTTLLESRLRGIRCFGSDISWLSLLASNTKIRFIDLDVIPFLCKQSIDDAKSHLSSASFEHSERCIKWFEKLEADKLASLQLTLSKMQPSAESQFLICGFLAIIRRVSKAFDGEVRPHINNAKKQRCTFQAFEKKIFDMLKNHADYQKVACEDQNSSAFFSDACNLDSSKLESPPQLIISHPPYLNAFNYAPVFTLEYMWGDVFEDRFVEEKAQFKNELKAHPANQNITNNYFELLTNAYKQCANNQLSNDKLAIVIGDCTRHKKLVPVIDTIIDRVEGCGYQLTELNLRTTHYGTGKYAYSNRSDYHSADEEKRDGVIVFTRQ